MKKIILFVLLICIAKVNAQVCFSSTTNFGIGLLSPAAVTSSDFNGDGFADLAVANDTANIISVFLGTGTGNFGAATNFVTGAGPTCIITKDFNADGFADLATSNCGGQNGGWSQSISILLGNGTGSFGTLGNLAIYTMSVTISSSITSADFNGDAILDLAAVYGYSDTVLVLLGTGTGSFGTASNFTLSSNSSPASIINADFNGDGKVDLATANSGLNNISILLGNGSGSFASATNFAVDSFPHSITSADFNGDGKADLATANSTIYNVKNISVLLGTGTGSFTSAINYTAGSSLYLYPYSIINEDFNEDGKVDLVTANYNNPGTLSVLLGNGSGSFSTAMNFTVGCGPSSICSADFNGDAKNDLASANYCSYDASVILNCTPTPTCVASVTDSLYNISPLNWGITPNYSPQVTSAAWNWGDGTSTNALYPSHTYTTAGWYNICVTVYTSCGDSSSTCRNDTLFRTANNSSMVNINVLQSPNGIGQIESSASQISIYPNPSNNNITIQSSTSLGAISIYNSLGEIVLQTKSKNTQEQIDVSKFPSGIYMVHTQGKYLKLVKE